MNLKQSFFTAAFVLLLHACNTTSVSSTSKDTAVGNGPARIPQPLPAQDVTPIGPVILDVTGEIAYELYGSMRVQSDVNLARVTTGKLDINCSEGLLAGGTQVGRGPVTCIVTSDSLTASPTHPLSEGGGFLELRGKDKLSESIFDNLGLPITLSGPSKVKHVTFASGRFACWEQRNEDGTEVDFRCQVSGTKTGLPRETAENAVIQAAEQESGTVCKISDVEVLPLPRGPILPSRDEPGPLTAQYNVSVSCDSASVSYHVRVYKVSVSENTEYRASTPVNISP